MKTLSVCIVSLFFLAVFSESADAIEVTATCRYVVGSDETLNQARVKAIQMAKRRCVQQVGVFPESTFSSNQRESSSFRFSREVKERIENDAMSSVKIKRISESIEVMKGAVSLTMTVTIELYKSEEGPRILQAQSHITQEPGSTP